MERTFDDAMMDVYLRARNECGYNATRYLQMLHEHRGLETARILLHAPNVSEEYVALWERKRLDLTSGSSHPLAGVEISLLKGGTRHRPQASG